MVIETRYAAGDGLLIGTGQHWLLLGGDPGPELIDELWALLTDLGPVVDAALDVLEKHFPDELRSLALLDLTPGATGSATRGNGRLVQDGDARLLSLGPPDLRDLRRIVGGVVSAGSVQVKEVAAPRVALRHPSEPPVPTRRALIDGIPTHILAATAPERATDPQRLARALDSAARTEVTEDPMGGARPTPYAPDPDSPPAFEPARDPDHDTSRPPVVEEARRGRLETPDGQPARTAHPRHPTSDTVLAVSCPAGHVTAAYTPECRVCHLPVPPQDPRRVPRPRLGFLGLPTGEVVPLDRGVVFGRKPMAVPGGEAYPHLVHLPGDSTYLSRLHLQIELDGWLVLARDLGSQGGTRLHVPGREPEQIRTHEAYVLEHGHTLALADVYPITFEVIG
ncbi:MAG: hypothetical protein ACR2JD_07755 [Nocardioides sp.]